MVTLKGDYIFVNPVYCEMTGYTKQEFSKMNVVDLAVNKHEKGSFERSIIGSEGNMIEIELCRKNRTSFWAEIRGKKIKIGNNTFALGIIRDITQNRSDKLSLIKSEERLFLALDGSASGLWDWNVKTDEVFFDANYFTISGYSPNAFEHSIVEWRKHVHPDDLKYVEGKINDYLYGTLKEYRVEFRFKTKSGDWMWVLGKGKVFEYDTDGKPIRFTGTHTDITSTKIAEKALLNSEKELRALNATKDKFFSIISHDLKSPLSSILGFTQVLSSNFDTYNDEEKKKAIEVLKDASENSYKLLENLLEWSRMQTGAIDFNIEPLNIIELVNNEFAVIKLSCLQKQIQLKVNSAKDFEVFADKNMISTVLRNLLSNAVKYTPKGGLISVDFKERAPTNDEKYLEIMVSDSGVGIEAKNIEKLFSVSESYKTPGIMGEKGTGLGLILCKEFVEKNNGEIWVESEVGKGSKFIFTLPYNSDVEN